MFNIYIPDGNLLFSDRGLVKIIDTVPGGEELLIIGDLNAHNGLWCGCGNDNRNGKTIFEFLMKSSSSSSSSFYYQYPSIYKQKISQRAQWPVIWEKKQQKQNINNY